MPYTPPSGTAVNLDFGGAYAAPLGGSVNLEFDAATASVVGNARYVSVGDKGTFGAVAVRQTPYVSVRNWPVTLIFGIPNIFYDIPKIYPSSIGDTSIVNSPTYVRWRRYLDMSGQGIENPIWPLGDGRVRLAGGYSVPPAINVILNWTTEPYSVPPATNVILEFGALGYGKILGATLFSQLSMGTPVLTQQAAAQPVGIPSASVFGTPTLNFVSQYIVPFVWVSSQFGTATIDLTGRQILVGGIAPPPQSGPDDERQLPSPTIWFRTRYVTPLGVAAPSPQFPTTHAVAFEYQYVDQAGRSIDASVFGTARIEFTVRYIEPPYVLSNVFGTANVARIQVISPSGWESSFISANHELDINLQRILYYTGEADPAEYGVTTIRNQFEVISPNGLLSEQINFPIIYNLDQYIQVSPFMNTNSDPMVWPDYYPFVENKNRELRVSGWQSSRFSPIGHMIENTARAIVVAGLDATEWGGETFISHWVRTVSPESWDSYYSSHYAVVYNNADVLAPVGWKSSVVERPIEVLNLNCTVKHIFPYGGEEFGTAFIAYRIRYVQQNVFNDVPNGIPEVRFNPYPISPPGIPTPQFGGATVYEHFNIIAPKSVNVFSVPRVGEPIVENRNRTLRVSPSDQSLYGLAKVFNYNTHIAITAGDLSIWGSHLISYRTKTITVAPISVPVFSVTHKIKNVIPDPPSQQRIEPASIYIGLEFRVGIVPAPVLRLATLYPFGISEEGYGKPTLTRNTIQPERGIFNLDQLGTPIIVFTQYAYPKSIPLPIAGGESHGDSDEFWTFSGRPRVTPHTIYAPSADQATIQARQNNPPGLGHKMDELLNSTYPWWGQHEVSNRNRTIYPISAADNYARYGGPFVDLSKRYIYPYPIKSLRFGFVVILDVPQYINLNTLHNGIAPYEHFGDTNVAFPPVDFTPTIRPTGFTGVFGTTNIELFNRTVFPSGIPHRGNPEQLLTNPWGLPLVGFPRIYTWGGYDMTLWGNTWVSHKNRSFEFQGWNSLSLEDFGDFTPFSDRMKVKRRNPDGGLAGIASTLTFGNAVVTTGIRGISAFGIFGYTSGSIKVARFNTILPGGWDSLVVGDIDRWEEGKIKPHGPDMSEYGVPRMCHTIRPSGINSGVVGANRFATPIRPTGIPEIGFMGPSISNPFGCTNRVVTPLPILSQQVVTQPAVSQ